MKKVLDCKRVLCAVLALCLVMCMVPLTASAADGIAYIDENGTELEYTDSYTTVASSTTTWSDGWYVVNSDVTISSRITVSGTVNLILADGCTLTASAGIQVSSGNTLNIYAQSTGDELGALTANGNDNNYSGIGGGNATAGGDITINGGQITATGGKYGAGIGGGNDYYGSYSGSGQITINGGTVTATGGYYGAGIGGGNRGQGDVTINGGTVTADGGYWGAGIGGGGCSGSSTPNGGTGNVTINNGTVIATGGDYGAGIGGGCRGTGNVTINGGTVMGYKGGDGAAGIGGGAKYYNNSAGAATVTITGGYIIATAGNADAHPIGRGDGTGASESVTITGGYFGTGDVTDQTIYSTASPADGYEVIANTDESSKDTYPVYVGIKNYYTVTIPASVSLGSSATIKASEVKLTTSQKLKVTLSGTSGSDNALTLECGSATLSYTITNQSDSDSNVTKDTVVLSVTGTGTTATSGSTTLDFQPDLTSITYAGNYTGTVTFTVSVETS